VLGELLVEGGDSLVSGSLGASGNLLGLELMELLRLDLSLGLELVNDVSLGPASEGGDVSEFAVISVGFHSQHSEGLRDDHSLLVVVRVGNTFEDLHLCESGGTTGALVGEHSSHDFPEHARGSGEMLEATAGVGVDSSILFLLPVELVSEERAGSVNFLGTHDNNALSTDDFFSNNASETTHKVTASVNDNLLFEHA